MGGGERGKKTCTSSNPGWYQFFKEVNHGWISKPSLQNYTWAYACAGSQETHFEGLLEVAELKAKRSCWKFSDLQQLPTMDNTGGQEVLAWRLVRRWRRPYIQPGGRYSTWLETWNHPPGGVLEAGEDERRPGWPATKPSSPYPFLLDQYWWLLVCKKFGLDDILVFSALDVLAQQIHCSLLLVFRWFCEMVQNSLDSHFYFTDQLTLPDIPLLLYLVCIRGFMLSVQSFGLVSIHSASRINMGIFSSFCCRCTDYKSNSSLLFEATWEDIVPAIACSRPLQNWKPQRRPLQTLVLTKIVFNWDCLSNTICNTC